MVSTCLGSGHGKVATGSGDLSEGAGVAGVGGSASGS